MRETGKMYYQGNSNENGNYIYEMILSLGDAKVRGEIKLTLKVYGVIMGTAILSQKEGTSNVQLKLETATPIDFENNVAGNIFINMYDFTIDMEIRKPTEAELYFNYVPIEP